MASIIKVDRIQSDTGTVNVASKIEFPVGSAAAPSIFPTGDTNTGIFFPAADTIAFTEGGAEAMRIDSSGNIGIGTSGAAPDGRLDVRGNMTVGNAAIGGGTILKIANSNASECYGYIGTTLTAVGFYCDATQVIVGAQTNIPYIMRTNATERARITSGGSFVMGGTAAPTIAGVGAQHGAYGPAGTGSWAMGLQQDTTSAGGGRLLGLRNVTDFNNSSNEIIYYTGNTTERFSFVSNGGLRNYSGNNVNLSDRREKTNFALAKNYLETICSIPVQSFNYIDQAEDDPGLTLGVVAQDVQEVAPELVMESNWGTQEEPKMRLAIYQTDLQYALMKSIQELKAINDAQASRIETLEAKVSALESQ